MLNGASARRTQILLLDDHPIIRFGFVALLSPLDSGFVFHEADTGREALLLAERHLPDLAVVDLSLAGALSFDLIKRLRRVSPSMKVLVVSMHDEKLYAERALRAGARGYLMKHLAAKAIPDAVRQVLDGKIWLSDGIRDALVSKVADGLDHPDKFSLLSDREVAVYAMIGQGMKKGDIANALSLSPNTIETYRTNIKQKMGIATGPELYRSAFLHFANSAESHGQK